MIGREIKGKVEKIVRENRRKKIKRNVEQIVKE